MNVPENLKYSADHEWIAIDGSTARVGITDYAQDALGDVVYVDLPSAGDAVVANAACSEVESTKSVSDIFAPVTGSIAEVNDSLADEPERLNEDPYGDGWLFTIEMSDPSEADGLLDATAYMALIEG